MKTAQDISTSFQEHYYRAIGWSFILAIFFKLFGTSIYTAFYTSSVLGSLTILNIFFIAFILSKKESIAIYSACLFATLPLHILWSGSAETNISSIFFLTLGLFFCLVYFEKKSRKSFLLALSAIVFCAHFRPENYLILFTFVVLVWFLLLRKVEKKDPLFIGGSFLAAIIIITPSFLRDLMFQLHFDWSRVNNTDTSWSIYEIIENLIRRFFNYSGYLFSNTYHPFIFSFLFIAGLFYLFIREKKKFLIIIFYGMLFYLSLYIFFVRGIGASSRIFLIFYPATVISASYFIDFLIQKLKNKKIYLLILFLLILLSFLFTFKKIVYPTNEWKVEELVYNLGNVPFFGKVEAELVRFAEEKISKDCIVLANEPEMLTTSNLSTGQISALKKLNEATFVNYNCVLFFKDVTCAKELRLSSEKKEYPLNCDKVEEDYLLSPLENGPLFFNGEEEFGFYKILSSKF